MALTGKKLAFGKALWAGMSNRDAAVAAGYSEKTAGPAGSRLAKDLDVKAYLVEMNKRAAAPKPKAAASKKGRAPDVINDDLLENDSDPKEFLRKMMMNGALEVRQRAVAAVALLPYEHQKLGEGGKKDQKQAAAVKAGTGKFGLRAVK